MIGQIWDAINDALIAERETLGILTAERAEQGKQSISQTPGCMTWLDVDSASVSNSDAAYSVRVDVTIFCISAPRRSSAETLDDALLIAVNVLRLLAGTTVSGAYLEATDRAIEIVDARANGAVVAVNLRTDVSLT
jgi:hypothetical protein